MKIVSLVPSITESLFSLGLPEEHLLGRTKFCIHPKNSVKKTQIIGGTKNINVNTIIALQPEIVLANKEENEKIQIEQLMPHMKVIVTDVTSVEDSIVLIKNLGNLIGKEENAQKICRTIESIFVNTKPLDNVKTAYLIWKNPYMSVGRDTFIHDVLSKLGFHNICGNLERYPIIETSQMDDAEVILLSSEPYPFKEKHIFELKERFPNKKILLVDGEAFSWFGTHIAQCGQYYEQLLSRVSGLR